MYWSLFAAVLIAVGLLLIPNLLPFLTRSSADICSSFFLAWSFSNWITCSRSVSFFDEVPSALNAWINGSSFFFTFFVVGSKFLFFPNAIFFFFGAASPLLRFLVLSGCRPAGGISAPGRKRRTDAASSSEEESFLCKIRKICCWKLTL